MGIEKELEHIRVQYNELTGKLNQCQKLSDAVPADKLGQVIRRTRKNQHLTMQELSDLSGISYATLSKIETGSVSVRFDLVINILQTLGLNLWIG
ncbi:helix-turn-helix domain-containing protein [Desulfobacter latus]|uniref:Helix-turn-helix transcriptional regulator n=1 Tax=Desulfobacter latus TaxID=2292 RepID=A0A850SZT2_9BACT|nr:helix-turn-helix transcriptional regulator [Desulfobacter latus]NWH06779.1 helix-turn-helix transcriptional regulator [Desulfobacter latus]